MDLFKFPFASKEKETYEEIPETEDNSDELSRPENKIVEIWEDIGSNFSGAMKTTGSKISGAFESVNKEFQKQKLIIKIIDNIKSVGKTDGYSSIRMKVIIAGILTVSISSVDLLIRLFSFEIKDFFLDFYVLLFGAAMIFLEGDVFELPSKWVETFHILAKFFEYSTLKGIFFLLAGIFQFIQKDNVVDVLSAGWTLHIGVRCVLTGVKTGEKVSQLHLAYASAEELANDFVIYDTDEDGFLKKDDFELLCGSKGIQLTPYEMEACFHVIGQDGKISKAQAMTWYNSLVNTSDIVV